MALTTHEKFHLNAMLTEQVEDKKDPAMMTKLANTGIKGISKTEAEYLDYLDSVKIKVNDILTSEIFPKLENVADIHDYLENK